MQAISWQSAGGANAYASRWVVVLIMATACNNELPVGSAAAGAAGATALAMAQPASVNSAGGTALVAGPALAVPVAAAPGASVTSVAPALETVAAHGVIGKMIDVGFLSDAGDGLRNLMMMDWEIPAGAEQYLCGRLTVPEETYLKGYRPLSPRGTHHLAVTVNEQPDAPDGVTECDVSEVGKRNVFGSGVGTLGRTLPEGIATKLARGSQIVFNVHLYNVTDAPLRGRSGSLVETIPFSDVKILADGVAVGPLKLSVPPGRSVQTGKCTVDRDYTLFSVMPHMHRRGVHLKLVAQHAAGGSVLLHDGPYDFENQLSSRFDPIEMKTGDTLAIECTYENPSSLTLHFGESTDDEMCIAGMGRYPAGGNSTCPY